MEEVWNKKLENLKRDQTPWKVGDIVISPYFSGQEKVRRKITSVRYIQGSSLSNFRVTVENLDPGTPLNTAVCASWFFPYTEPKPATKALSELKGFPPAILKLNAERLEAKKAFRKLRTGEAHLTLLAIDSKLAAAVSRYLSK